MFKGIQFQLAAKIMNAFTGGEKKQMDCIYKRVCMLWKNMLLQDIW